MNSRAPVFNPVAGRRSIKAWKKRTADSGKNNFFYVDSKMVNICGVDVKTVPSGVRRVTIVIFLTREIEKPELLNRQQENFRKYFNHTRKRPKILHLEPTYA